MDLRYCTKSTLLLLILALPCPFAAAANPNAPPASAKEASPLVNAPGHPDVAAIVRNLQLHNRLRARELQSYTDLRHYSVSYHGFPIDLSAGIVVEATYDAPSTKRFRIVSESGSKFLVDHVLKKLLAAEQQAASHPRQAAIDQANYSFTYLGMQTLAGRPCFVLRAVPKSRSHLLFRGRVWIDAKDYAVSKVVAEPARNPSFWIKDTHIHHVYSRTGPFWLPQSDRSTTDVRFGGSAVLTIDYGVYHPVSRKPKG